MDASSQFSLPVLVQTRHVATTEHAIIIPGHIIIIPTSIYHILKLTICESELNLMLNIV